jgi:predicted porin
MKKSLLAIAAMTAFAGAAQAQSSVTVYGILDIGFVGSQYNGTSVAANGANVNNAPSTQVGSISGRQSTAGFGQSGESTSRIGFKGTEDLGGGTSAIFTLELGLSPISNGGSYSSTAGQPPGVWGQMNRQTFVGLSKQGLGTATTGTQYTLNRYQYPRHFPTSLGTADNLILAFKLVQSQYGSGNVLAPPTQLWH